MYFEALSKVCYGMYIVSSKDGDKFDGQIANTVFQTTAIPPIIAISISKENLTHEYIEKSKMFSVSILNIETDMLFIGKFGFKSGKDIDKFKDTKFKIDKTGCPIVLDNTIAYLEAEVINSIDVGTHTLFIGKVVNSGNVKDGVPLTYEYYHMIKKGKSPKTAPTYKMKNEK